MSPTASHDGIVRWLRWRGTSPYPAASTLALALANAISLLIDPGPRDAAFVVFLSGLVLALGLVHGVLWRTVQALLHRLPRWLTLSFWPLAAVAGATALAVRLGAFSRLVGRYQLLAVGALCICGLGALAFGALLNAMQPTARSKRGFLAERSSPFRLLTVLTLIAAALVLSYADRRFYVTNYAIAHVALRVCALWLTMFALVLCDTWVRLPRVTPAWALVVCAWVAIPLTQLDEHDGRTMQGFATRTWPSIVLEGARALLDFDGDRYSSLLGGGDCAPFDSRIGPGAQELPGNGIDDNCTLGDAPRRRQPPTPASSTPDPRKPPQTDVVIITVDTLRADHLGVYDPSRRRPGRRTTPNLDRWASKATVFRNAFTPGGWTSIALPSLMRGMYPRKLNWTRYYETNHFRIVYTPLDPRITSGREVIAQLFPFAYSDPRPPLAELLQRRGMYTAAVVDDGPSDQLQPGLGFETGFKVLKETDHVPIERRNDRGTTELALEVLRSVPQGQRFFLWVHYFGPHYPDELHAGIPNFGDSIPERYAHTVAFLDQQLQPLLAALEQRTPEPAIFIMSDHGEMLLFDQRHHGMTLEDGAIRIPLLARVPGWPTGDVTRPVSLVDVAPTILKLTNSPVPEEVDGDTLDPRESTRDDGRILLSDTWRYDQNGRAIIDFVAAYDGQRKLVLDRLNQYLFSYDASGAATQLPVDKKLRKDPLYRALYGYLDETGGQLDLKD